MAQDPTTATVDLRAQISEITDLIAGSLDDIWNSDGIPSTTGDLRATTEALAKRIEDRTFQMEQEGGSMIYLSLKTDDALR